MLNNYYQKKFPVNQHPKSHPQDTYTNCIEKQDSLIPNDINENNLANTDSNRKIPLKIMTFIMMS